LIEVEGVTDGENEGGDCDEVIIMRRMRWTRRTVNRMRLTEWRRGLIPQLRGWACHKSLHWHCC